MFKKQLGSLSFIIVFILSIVRHLFGIDRRSKTDKKRSKEGFCFDQTNCFHKQAKRRKKQRKRETKRRKKERKKERKKNGIFFKEEQAQSQSKDAPNWQILVL